MPLTKATQNVVEGIVSTGSTGLSAGLFIVGQQYKITSLGTTTQSQWNTIAGTTGQTYVVGSLFTAATTGASSGNGAAAVARTLANRFADVVNVKDFGAVGDGVTDDRQAWVNIINQFPTQQVTVYIPRGEYTCSGSTLIAPNNILFKFDKGAKIKTGQNIVLTNVQASNANDTQVKQSEGALGYPDDQAQFNYIELSGDTETQSREQTCYLDLVDTTQNVRSFAKGSYGRSCEIRYGGNGCSGGFVGLGAWSYFLRNQPAGSFSNGVGILGYAASLGVNAGGTLAVENGSLYGSNFYARADSGSTFFSNITGSEVNTEVSIGASVSFKSLIQLVGADGVQGYDYDIMLALSNKGGASGWKTGIGIGTFNGAHPIATTGKIIETIGSATVSKGIDFSSYTFNSFAIHTPNFTVDQSGRVSSGNYTAVDNFASFQTNANLTGQERGIHFGKSGSYGLWCGFINDIGGFTGGAIRQISSDPLAIIVNNTTRVLNILSTGNVEAGVDNAYTWGASGKKWSAIWAANGTIQTSDERKKTQIKESELGLDFIESLKPVSYKWIVGGNKVDSITTFEEKEVQDSEDIEIEEEVIEIENGINILRKVKKTISKPIFDEVFVFDENKQPVYEKTVEKNKDGIAITSKKQKTILVPRMVKKTVEVQKQIETPVEGKRTHFGLIAQEVEESLNGIDFGGLVITENNEYSLRYDQFICPLIKAVKELSDKVKLLESK